MNNAEFLQDAIGHIDDSMIINAENTVRRRRISPIIAHISAAAAVIAAIIVVLPMLFKGSSPLPPSSSPHQGISPFDTPAESSSECTPPDSSPIEIPDSTPDEVPDGSELITIGGTPIETPETTPEESTPDVPPEPKPEDKYLLDYIPDAGIELTADQMAEIEEKLGEEIDWDTHYFGTHNGYIVFGTTDGSDANLFQLKNRETMARHYGFIHALYGYKDGAIYDFDSLFDGAYIDTQSAMMIASYGILKTVGDVPVAEKDMSEDERNTIDAAIRSYTGRSPMVYHGTYEGYAIYGVKTFALDDITIPHSKGSMNWEWMGDIVAYKDGTVYDVKDLLYDGLISYRSVRSAFYFHKIIIIYYDGAWTQYSTAETNNG